ncbi:MAG: HupE/UreJ family protein [Daejeonella sp.]|uniref:HupE/UreJ family protein n=1 Tax=Daejeonella sp. TaxID=2805397 RepID=UPI002734783B|nr:HupE/UreJ family protein [Daejeonella sp.]MDP3466988.1 HupE/UreJ family protein [Daejeonella sp.]
MGQFELYFRLGTNHILDLAGFDHILFVIVLCSLYSISDWKRIIILVTAFTIGHSLTLALATFKLLFINSNLIEFLIPVTIAITAAGNIIHPKAAKGIQLNYFFAIFFGLIHGLGFSSYLQALLGNEVSILNPLFAFNVGLEAGQLLIVLFFLLLSLVPLLVFKVNQKQWTLVVSSIILGMAIMMMIESKFW